MITTVRREKIQQEYREENAERKKKRTLRSELIYVLILTSAVTLVLVSGILSLVLFRGSTMSAWRDIQFYMASTQEQFAEKLLFLEEEAVFLKDSQMVRRFLHSDRIRTDEMEDVMEKEINLFSDRNRIAESYPIVRDIYIYSRDYKSAGTHFYPDTQSSYKSLGWHLQNETIIFSGQDTLFFYQKNGDELDLIFNIYDDYLDVAGYCAVVFSLPSIEKIFEKMGKYETYYWGLETTDGRTVGGTGLPAEKEGEFTDSVGQIRCGSEEYLYSVQKNSFGLTSYILVPRRLVYQSVLPEFLLAWVVSLSMIFVVIVVINHFGKRLTSPMLSVVEKLNQFGTGDFEVHMGEYDIEEFQLISTSFNDMTAKINQLVKEVYENKIIAQESKIQYLQAQINPHFMFNVLSTIALRLKMNKDEDLYRMVTAFAGLMQGKLFRKNQIEIRLEEEIEIAEFYLYLQGERFKDTISYEIMWESEELRRCMIPRLSIEPLVENAVTHGLEPKGEHGTISVRIRKTEEGLLSITVADDGVGFDYEKIQLEEEARSPRVGILNIQRLVHNLYGEGYGLKISSRVGEGTVMELLLPCREDRVW